MGQAPAHPKRDHDKYQPDAVDRAGILVFPGLKLLQPARQLIRSVSWINVLVFGEVHAVAKDVFISYSTRDKAIAGKLCMILEELGLDCWIGPRDIAPGAEFDVAILDGIDQCQAMVVVLSVEANISVFVKNEVNRAFSRGKPIFTFRVEDIKPAKALEFYLARHQWTDGFPPPVEERIARIARALLELLGKPSAEPSICAGAGSSNPPFPETDASAVQQATMEKLVQGAESSTKNCFSLCTKLPHTRPCTRLP